MYWIRGKNNIGKSALLKAISTLFTNVSNNKYKAFLRDNTDTFTIRGYFGRDWVELSRGAIDYYEWCIEGEVFRVDKTGGKVPPELRDFFDLYYEPEKTKRYLNITGADEPLLFVSTTGGDNDRLFQKALGTEDITNASKESDRLKRLQASQRKTIQGLLDERMQQITPLEFQYNQSVEEFNRIRELEQVLDTEFQVYEQVVKQVEEVDVYTQLGSYYVDLIELFNYVEESNIDDAIKQLGKITNQIEQLKLHQELQDSYETLADVDDEEFTQVPALLGQVSLITKTIQLEQQQSTIEQQLSQLNEGLMEDAHSIPNNLNTITHITKAVNHLKQYDDLYQQLSQLNEELTHTEQEFEEARSNLGICPYCQTELGSTHTHTH